ncbi:hypothetical protein CGCVW01_v014493 [Colletotrichum viniferum]|nr:hypothetical protein CGCVW01_v014493 [Colletotrichum viniferum]
MQVRETRNQQWQRPSNPQLAVSNPSIHTSIFGAVEPLKNMSPGSSGLVQWAATGFLIRCACSECNVTSSSRSLHGNTISEKDAILRQSCRGPEHAGERR